MMSDTVYDEYLINTSLLKMRNKGKALACPQSIFFYLPWITNLSLYFLSNVYYVSTCIYSCTILEDEGVVASLAYSLDSCCTYLCWMMRLHGVRCSSSATPADHPGKAC